MELNIKKTFYVLMELLGDNAPLTIPMPSFDIDWFNVTGEYRYSLPIQRPSIKEETAQYELCE